jgi:hypothetical protein
MTRRIAYALLATIVLALVAAQGASAASASSNPIHKDASDGVIDGDYTMEEMREADRTVSASAREYYGWEDAYADYMRRQADPDAPAVAVPIDSNKDGKIDSKEKAAAVKKTKSEAKKKKKKKKKAVVVVKKSSGDDCDEDDDDKDCEIAAAAGDDDGAGDGGSWLIWLIVGLPVLIVGFGAWRMASRKTPNTGDPSDTLALGALPQDESEPRKRRRRAREREAKAPRRPPTDGPEPGSTPSPGQP